MPNLMEETDMTGKKIFLLQVTYVSKIAKVDTAKL